jgi:hypothetical protein
LHVISTLVNIQASYVQKSKGMEFSVIPNEFHLNQRGKLFRRTTFFGGTMKTKIIIVEKNM